MKIYLRVHKSSLLHTFSEFVGTQRDIDLINSTGKSWGLCMNIQKCVAIRFQHGSSVNWDSLWAYSQYYLDNEPIKFVQSHVDLGVTIDVSLRFHDHIRSIVGKAAGFMSNILRSTLCCSSDFMVPIYTTYIRPLIEFSSCIWFTMYVGDLSHLEGIQRRWTRNIDGCCDLEYADRLKRLDLYSVKGRLIRADLINCWKVFHAESTIEPNEIFNLASHMGTRVHCFKLSPQHVNYDFRRRFFIERVIPFWNQLPECVVNASSKCVC